MTALILLMFITVAASPDTVKISFHPPKKSAFLVPVKTSSRIAVEGSFSAGLFSLCNDLANPNTGFVFTSEQMALRWTVERPGTFSLLTSFNHKLGADLYIDSVSRVSLDENLLKCHLDWKFSSDAGFAVDSEISTRIFNQYNMQEERYASFLTPMIWNLVAGVSFRVCDISILAGITGLRMIYFKDEKVLASGHNRSYYNIPEEKNQVLDYGLHAQIRFDKLILKLLRWNLEFMGFKNLKQPAGFTLRNLFEFKWNKVLVTSLNTHISFDHRLGSKIRIENKLTVGLTFRLIR